MRMGDEGWGEGGRRLLGDRKVENKCLNYMRIVINLKDGNLS